jgi:uncharacterized membrane protein
VFLFKGKEQNGRSLAKAVSWRILRSIDTFVLGMIFTHRHSSVAGKIAGAEVITKILLYFFHERLWAQTSWGFRLKPRDAVGEA